MYMSTNFANYGQRYVRAIEPSDSPKHAMEPHALTSRCCRRGGVSEGEMHSVTDFLDTDDQACEGRTSSAHTHPTYT